MLAWFMFVPTKYTAKSNFLDVVYLILNLLVSQCFIYITQEAWTGYFSRAILHWYMTPFQAMATHIQKLYLEKAVRIYMLYFILESELNCRITCLKSFCDIYFLKQLVYELYISFSLGKRSGWYIKDDKDTSLQFFFISLSKIKK